MRPFILDPEITELRRKAEVDITTMLHEHNVALEKFTREQMAKAIVQAIQCGDFEAMVCHAPFPEVKMAITYIPFRNEEKLKSRIAALEQVIKDAGLTLPE